MTGRRMADVHGLAAELRLGATAEVVGGEPLTGVPPVVWFDDERVHIEAPDRTAQPGVRLVRPDGFVALWVTRDREAADALLRDAQAVAFPDNKAEGLKPLV